MNKFLNVEVAQYLNERPVLFFFVLLALSLLLRATPRIVVYVLLRIGLVRYYYDSERVRWPISIDPPHLWALHIRCLFRGQWFCSRTDDGSLRKGFPWSGPGGFCAFGVFRNLPWVIKWEKGRLLPRRWGFHILGLEIGDRG